MYYYRHFDRQVGPVTFDALVAEAGLGALYPTDLVWTDGWPAWREASQVEGLFPNTPAPGPGVSPGAPSPYARLQQPYRATDDGPLMRAMLPVGRSFWAIVAGYLGLFSPLLLPAPFAILTGILAIRDIRANPHLHGMGRAVFAIVMGILGCIGVVMVILGLMQRS